MLRAGAIIALGSLLMACRSRSGPSAGATDAGVASPVTYDGGRAAVAAAPALDSGMDGGLVASVELACPEDTERVVQRGIEVPELFALGHGCTRVACVRRDSKKKNGPYVVLAASLTHVALRGTFADDVTTGLETHFCEAGTKTAEGPRTLGLRSGTWRTFVDGKLVTIEEHVPGGNIVREKRFEDGKCVTLTTFNDEEVVDVRPCD